MTIYIMFIGTSISSGNSSTVSINNNYNDDNTIGSDRRSIIIGAHTSPRSMLTLTTFPHRMGPGNTRFRDLNEIRENVHACNKRILEELAPLEITGIVEADWRRRRP